MADFVSWQRNWSTPDGTKYQSASPNLTALAKYLAHTWSMGNAGIYNKRPIRGGTAWSSHAYGAALDASYNDLQQVDSVVIPWLIEHHKTLGIQRIHHYKHNKYWQAGQGWIQRTPGQGGQWLHIETHPNQWDNSTPITDRFGNQPANNPPKYPGKPIKRGSTGNTVKLVQDALGLTVDGKFGPITEQQVKALQQAHSLTVDGIVGPITWAAIFDR